MPYRVPTTLNLSGAERAELEGWARRRKTAQARALRPAAHGRAAGRAQTWGTAADRRRADRGAGGPHALGAAGGHHALEPADHGQGLWTVGHDGGPGLARLACGRTGPRPSS